MQMHLTLGHYVYKEWYFSSGCTGFILSVPYYAIFSETVNLFLYFQNLCKPWFKTEDKINLGIVLFYDF